MTSLLILTLITWLRQGFSAFSIIKFLFYLSWQTLLLEGSDNALPTLMGWNMYIKCLEFYMGDLSLLIYLFIYLLSQSFIYISVDTWVILCLSYNPVVHYLFCCSTCSNFGHWELSLCGPVSCDIPHHCGVLLLLASLFGTLSYWHWNTLQANFVCFLPSLESAIYPKALFLLFKNGIRKQTKSRHWVCSVSLGHHCF